MCNAVLLLESVAHKFLSFFINYLNNDEFVLSWLTAMQHTFNLIDVKSVAITTKYFLPLVNLKNWLAYVIDTPLININGSILALKTLPGKVVAKTISTTSEEGFRSSS